MVDKHEFEVRKIELLHLYIEYTDHLQNLKPEDLNKSRTLYALSNLHQKLIECQISFSQFLAEKINTKQ